MSSTPDNPYRPPEREGVVHRGNRARWIEHRLREAYVATCAAIMGWFLFRWLPHPDIFAQPLFGDAVVLLLWTGLPAVIAVFAMRASRLHGPQHVSPADYYSVMSDSNDCDE